MLKYDVYISPNKCHSSGILMGVLLQNRCVQIMRWEFTLVLIANKHSDPHKYLSTKNGLLVFCSSGDNDKPENFCWHTRDGEFQVETTKSLLSHIQIHLSFKKPQVSSNWALIVPTFHLQSIILYFISTFSTDNSICSKNQGTVCKIVTQEVPFGHFSGSFFLM